MRERRRTAGGAAGRRAVLDAADELHSAAIHLLRLLRREDDASGVTAPRLSVLSVLVFAGPTTLGALAAAEQVRPPTMSRMVAAMERDGLVRREHDAHDRRVVRLHATARGEQLLKQGRERRLRALAARMLSLRPQQLETLRSASRLMESLARTRTAKE